MTGSNPDEPCIEDDGVCDCISGFTGDICDECASGYYASGIACLRMINISNINTLNSSINFQIFFQPAIVTLEVQTLMSVMDQVVNAIALKDTLD